MRLARAVGPLVGPGGLLVASGIIDERADEVTAGLAKAGLAVTETLTDRGWVALVANRADTL